MRIARRGATIVELLVALVLGAIVLGLVATSVTAQRKNERKISIATQGISIVDEAISVLSAAAMRISSADTVRLRSDTAIDIDATVGTGIACWIAGDSIIIRDDGVSAAFEVAPDSADVVVAMTAGTTWQSRVISARTRTTTSGTCNGPQRILHTQPLPIATIEPPVVRITRRTRFTVYRGGDNAWWLGSRTCSTGASVSCAAAQPIAGPLAGNRALQFSVDTTSGVPFLTVRATSGTTTRTAVLPLRP